MIVLVFKQGPQKGKQLELDKPRVTFGRDPDSDVVLDDPRASWAHFVIERGEDGGRGEADLQGAARRRRNNAARRRHARHGSSRVYQPSEECACGLAGTDGRHPSCSDAFEDCHQI